MRELALHLLDIAENSVSAKADTISIRVEEDQAANRLRMSVEDNGVGMSAEMTARVVDPFVTSRTTRKVGLGIPLLKAAAEDCNGELTIQSTLGQGTCLTVEFQEDHIDRMPLGNLASTILTLVVGSPEVHWIFQYTVNGQTFEFDNQPIKEALGDVPCTDPGVLGYLRECLETGITEVSANKQPMKLAGFARPMEDQIRRDQNGG